MSKIYFRYGTLNSAKTANLLMVVHNYESQGKTVLIFKPKTDTRSKPNVIESRIGLSHSCIDIDEDFNIYDYVKRLPMNIKVDCICCEEVQFMTKQNIKELVKIADELEIPILAYGLKNTYIADKLFPAVELLLYYADSIEEVKNVCYCGRKATQNLRIVNGNPVYDGDTVQVGDVKEGDSYYMSVCRKHYFNPRLHK